VLSHSDADHLGTVDEILDAYTVKKVIRSGLRRSTGT
jgi:beta-lactamase superfamily II metal-dependent hydrolase